MYSRIFVSIYNAVIWGISLGSVGLIQLLAVEHHSVIPAREPATPNACNQVSLPINNTWLSLEKGNLPRATHAVVEKIKTLLGKQRLCI